MSTDHLILTAASAECGLSLLALLGSLNLNWRDHPPVLVYDVGLDDETLATLDKNNVPVRKVPACCPHWREHHTWKFWCLNDTPSLNILWIDPGVVVLQPLDEVFDTIRTRGYFVTTNDERLESEASEDACRGCAVPSEFRVGKLTLAATVIGFRKQGQVRTLLEEALRVAGVEEPVAATALSRRSDHALLSLLLYKHFGQVVVADGAMYLCRLSPRQTPGQKLWVHRRKLLQVDAAYLGGQISTIGDPYLPSPPFTLSEARTVENFFRAFRFFARSDRRSAEAHLRDALADADFMTPFRIASTLEGYRQRLHDAFGVERGDGFVAWAVTIIAAARGRSVARKVRSALYGMEGAKRLQRGEAENGCRLLARSVFAHPTFAVAHRRQIAESIRHTVRKPG